AQLAADEALRHGFLRKRNRCPGGCAPEHTMRSMEPADYTRQGRHCKGARAMHAARPGRAGCTAPERSSGHNPVTRQQTTRRGPAVDITRTARPGRVVPGLLRAPRGARAGGTPPGPRSLRSHGKPEEDGMTLRPRGERDRSAEGVA